MPGNTASLSSDVHFVCGARRIYCYYTVMMLVYIIVVRLLLKMLGQLVPRVGCFKRYVAKSVY